jgi:PAS domain S-box-containing protein
LETYGFITKHAGASVLIASVGMAFRLWDAHQRQQADERQYRVLVENTPDIIIRFDTACRFLYVSPAIRLITERKPRDFIGRRLEEMGFNADLAARWENAIENAILLGADHEQEIRVPKPDGEMLDLNWRLIPERDETGKVVTVLSLIRDITSQKKAENYRIQNELRMAFLLDLYSHAHYLGEHELVDRAVRTVCQLSASSSGSIEFVTKDSSYPVDTDLMLECIRTGAQVVRNQPEDQGQDGERKIFFPVVERDRVVMILVVRGKKVPYDDTERNQLQLTANEVYRMLSRRRADEALQESYQQYQTILNTAADGFFMLDENGQFIDVNEVYLKQTGYRKTEILKMSIASVEQQTNGKDLAGFLRRIIVNSKTRYETRHKCRNGAYVDVENTITYIPSSKKFICFVHDITYRKQSEQKLLRMQHLLGETGRTAHIGGWEYDLETNHMSWTDEVFKIHDVGLDFVPTLDRTIAFYWDDSIGRYSEAIKELREHQTPFDLTLHIRTATGRTKWVRTMGRPIIRQESMVAMAGTVQDITDQKNSETAALENGRRLNSFFNLSLDLFGIMDAEGRFISLNPAWEKALGQPVSQVVGKRLIDYAHPEDVPATLKAMHDALSSRRDEFVNRLRRIDGQFRWIRWRTAPTDNLIYCAATDITNEHATEIELRQHIEWTQSVLDVYRAHPTRLDDLLDRCIAIMLRLTGSLFGYVTVLRHEEQVIRSLFKAAEGANLGQIGDEGHLDIRKAGLWAESLRLRRPVIHNEFQQLTQRKGYPRGHVFLLRHLSVPIILGGEVRMIAGLGNKEMQYEDNDVRRVDEFMCEIVQLMDSRPELLYQPGRT